MSQRLADLRTPTLICSDVVALTLPPPSYAAVPGWWASESDGCIPEVDIELWADDARALTAVEMFAGTPHPFTFTDITFTAELAVKAFLDLATKTTNCTTVIEASTAGEGDNAITMALVQSGAAPNAGALTHIGLAYTFTFKNGVTTVANLETAIAASADLDVKTPGAAHVLVIAVDEFAATNLAGGDDTSLIAVAHGLSTGDGPSRVTGTAPAGLANLTDYWVIADGTGEFKLAASLADAMAGVAVVITDVGSGTLKLVATADTQRVHWTSHGLLGPAGDGVVTLTAVQAQWATRPHRPRVAAYALKATFGAGAGKVTAAIYPVVDER